MVIDSRERLLFLVFNVIFNVCMLQFFHNKRAEEEERRSFLRETRIHNLLYHKTKNKTIQIDTNNVVRYYYDYDCYHSRGE